MGYGKRERAASTQPAFAAFVMFDVAVASAAPGQVKSQVELLDVLPRFMALDQISKNDYILDHCAYAKHV